MQSKLREIAIILLYFYFFSLPIIQNCNLITLRASAHSATGKPFILFS